MIVGGGGGVSCVVLFFLMSYRSRLMFTKRTSLRRVCTFAEYQLGTTTKRHGKISKNVDRNCSFACLQMSGWLEGSPFHKLQGLRGPFSDIFSHGNECKHMVCWSQELLVIPLNSFKQPSDLHSGLAFCINAIMKYSSRKKFFSPPPHFSSDLVFKEQHSGYLMQNH